MLGIVMFSFILGGGCWNSSVTLLDSRDKDNQSQFLKVLVFSLAKRFGKAIATFLVQYYKHIAEKPPQRQQQQCRWPFLLQNLVSCVQKRPKQQNMCVNDYLQLAADVQEHFVYAIITNHKEQFMMQSLCEWKVLINKYQLKSVVEDFESVQSFIEEINDKYGEITQDFLKADLTLDEECILGMEVHTSEKKSNKRQLALAQYCVCKLFQVSRQLQVVPFGQGKSRIPATSAAIAPISGAQSALLGYDETWIQYHADSNFTPAKGELVILDEADEFMLNMIEEFIKLLNQYACLGFIATLDNCDANGAVAKMDENVQAASIEEKAAYIKKFQVSDSVLVNYIVDHAQEFKKICSDYILATEDINSALFENFDQLLFQIRIFEGEFGMSSFDYRCKQAKMTLVNVNYSLTSEAIVKFTDLDLIDNNKELQYTAKLFLAHDEAVKDQIMVKALQVEAMSKGFSLSSVDIKICSVLEIRKPNQQFTMLPPSTSSS
ncbi:UNKNOWN [Stylonychia lemnae]|uniref:Uncharacterized protein n=1 Tax=Stylonychia lemnae TaxID=5949 RepID=A0A077ZW14_STYLE|nr:UNKNOWN [Stylonychia lemnae]|eukprot:CDW74140.1 UNKNOWN [Stylonychia lemnae]